MIEQATLGFGRFTSQWFEHAPAPDDDGDVLVILFDGKGTPQATEQELELRRQSWKDRPRASSPRHRGRQNRGQRPYPVTVADTPHHVTFSTGERINAA